MRKFLSEWHDIDPEWLTALITIGSGGAFPTMLSLTSFVLYNLGTSEWEKFVSEWCLVFIQDKPW